MRSLFLRFGCLCLTVVVSLGLVSCSSSKYTEEQILYVKKHYNKPATEDEYVVRPAGFAVKTPLFGLTRMFIRQPTSDFVEFRIAGECASYDAISRESRYVVGRLSFYTDQHDYFASPDAALQFISEILVRHGDPDVSVRILDKENTLVSGKPGVKYHLLLVNGGMKKLNSEQVRMDWTRNAEMILALVKTEQAFYVSYLLENQVDRWLPTRDEIIETPREIASTQMDSLFTRFADGIRLDVR